MRSIRDSLLESHRYINVDHDWWGYIYDDIKAEMAQIGVFVNNIGFSGFSSQGDGAFFECDVTDWTKFLPAAGVHNAALAAFLSAHYAKFSVTHSGLYSHEHGTRTRIEAPLFPGASLGSGYVVREQDWLEEYGTENTVRDAAVIACLNLVDSDILFEGLHKHLRNRMRKLYRELEREYDYLTSDAAVSEAIEANDIHIETF